jgi:hypothetical protein
VCDGNDTNPDLNALAENYAKSGGVPYVQQPVEHTMGRLHKPSPDFTEGPPSVKPGPGL